MREAEVEYTPLHTHIPEKLGTAVRRWAKRNRRTLTSVVEQAIEEFLANHKDKGRPDGLARLVDNPQSRTRRR